MSTPVQTVEGIISVEAVSKLIQLPYSTFPVLNSAGNIVGMIPKNFLIVLIEYHHWLDESKLTAKQKAKLPRMYRRSSFSGDTSILDTRGGQTVVNDPWFTKEFNAEEIEQFKKQKTAMREAEQEQINAMN